MGNRLPYIFFRNVGEWAICHTLRSFYLFLTERRSGATYLPFIHARCFLYKKGTFLNHLFLSFIIIPNQSSGLIMGNKKEDQEYSSLAVNTSELSATPTLVASRFVDFPPWMKTSLPILCYCTASIMMTVVNKYVVSGDFNMVFLLLAVQVKGGSYSVQNLADYSLFRAFSRGWIVIWTARASQRFFFSRYSNSWTL